MKNNGWFETRGGRWCTTSGCNRVFAGFGAVSTERRRRRRQDALASGIRGELGRRFDQGQFGGGNPGLGEPVTVMGDVVGAFPVVVAQMPFDGEGRMVVHEDFGGVGGFLGASELGERGR